MEKINFLMGIHCHQPVDNMGSIFEDGYNKSYEPFLTVLERHPKIRLSLHYSGPVLDWLVANRPAFLDRVKGLIDRHQVEILTGGYFEPILPMIPDGDAKGQVEMLTGTIKRHFNFKPNGIWLAERVWNPSLTSVFKDLDIRYTVLDDFHLEQAGIEKARVFGYYNVRGGFSVFASIKKLRYTMPFREPQVTIDFLKKLYGNPEARCVTFADDCEKFGLWPYTYDWVYKKGWLERFFAALEANDWIRTLTFSDALKEIKSSGEADIPHSSYAEMMEWCGGNFNNFFIKYPEADLMRRRMLYVSEKIKSSAAGLRSEEKMANIKKAKVELYKSQSNCAYWHGVFGGVYTNYLRHGVYNHIIKAEEALGADGNAEGIEMVKTAGGGGPGNIICARNKFLTVFINPDYAGSIFEIDYKPLSLNLTATMSRRYEPYHEKISRSRKIDTGTLEKNMDEDTPIDLYETLGVRERNLKKFLNYDSYRKFSALCHVMSLKTSLSDFIKSAHTDSGGENLFGPYTYETKKENGRIVINLQRDGRSLRLNKCVILERDAGIFIRFDLENISSGKINCLFGVEFNWSIEDALFLRDRRKKQVREIALVDRFSGIKISHVFGEAMNLWSFPVYTLSESERGIGKTFQEISLLFYRRLALAGNQKFSLEAKVRISSEN